jgi:single-strand DNA-binding protein
VSNKGINKVILLGHCGKEPVVKTINNGLMASFSVATTDVWRDRESGEKREQTEWHNCVVFGPLAQVVQGYVKKGSKLHIEGQIQTRAYEKDGEKRYITQVLIKDLLLLDSKQKAESGDNSRAYAKASQSDYSKPLAKGEHYDSDPFDDSIPF